MIVEKILRHSFCSHQVYVQNQKFLVKYSERILTFHFESVHIKYTSLFPFLPLSLGLYFQLCPAHLSLQLAHLL